MCGCVSDRQYCWLGRLPHVDGWVQFRELSVGLLVIYVIILFTVRATGLPRLFLDFKSEVLSSVVHCCKHDVDVCVVAILAASNSAFLFDFECKSFSLLS